MAAANITETMSLSHSLAITPPAVASGAKTVSISGNSKISQTGSRVASGIQQATVTAAAIDIATLGGGTLGRFGIKNLDSANNLIVLTAAASGVAFVNLLPGEMTQGRFGTGVTAPAVQASAATVLFEYVICEA